MRCPYARTSPICLEAAVESVHRAESSFVGSG